MAVVGSLIRLVVIGPQAEEYKQMQPATSTYDASDGTLAQAPGSRTTPADYRVRLLVSRDSRKSARANEPEPSSAVVISMSRSTARAMPLTLTKARVAPKAKARATGGAMTI